MTDLKNTSRQKRWWKESIAYQIYPRSFYDSNGDGMGDLSGIIEKLDYLKTLGIDLLWLTPVYASPDRDNGYDISDYQAINPQFGTMADMERLIAEAHERDIRIIMDLVVNHTSNQHPWFVESRKSKINSYRDFYIWRDGKAGWEPNNWRAHFSKSAWTYDEQTDQYYLHTFSPYQPDLNWDNPQLRAAVHRMIEWWLEKGIDGFRLDAISFISKAPGLPDHPGPDPYIFDLDNMMHGPNYHAYLHELHQVMDKYAIVTVGECIDLTVESAIEVAAPERQELDMPFLFEHSDQTIRHGKSPAKLKEILTRWQLGIHQKTWIGLSFNSHDLPRVVSLFGDDSPEHRKNSAKLFGTLLLTLECTPFIYQGEEIGMTNVAFPTIEHYNDLAMFNQYHEMINEKGLDPTTALAMLQPTSRDNARTPMQWSSETQAGFTTGMPWLGVNPNYHNINVAQALADPASIFHHYQKLIRLRKSVPALIYGAYHLINTENDSVFAYSRTLDDEQIVVVLNLGAEPAKILLPEQLRFSDACYMPNKLLISNYPDTRLSEEQTRLLLRPYEACVYQLATGSTHSAAK